MNPGKFPAALVAAAHAIAQMNRCAESYIPMSFEPFVEMPTRSLAPLAVKYQPTAPPPPVAHPRPRRNLVEEWLADHPEEAP